MVVAEGAVYYFSVARKIWPEYVESFVGFLAGYNHFHGSLWMGTLGLLATTFYTFLPCFFFVFAGAPLVERTEDNPRIGGVLELITAVVVGAILDLTLFLGKAVIFPSGIAGLKQLDLISLSGVICRSSCSTDSN